MLILVSCVESDPAETLTAEMPAPTDGLSGRVSPSLVGVDIGCGMEVGRLVAPLDIPALDAFIHEHIPAGKRN